MSKFILIEIISLVAVVHGLVPPGSDLAISSQGYVLPQFDPNPAQRSQEVVINHGGYLYGPPLIGNSSYFPAGSLGSLRVGSDVKAFIQNAAFITDSIQKEAPAVVTRITEVQIKLALTKAR